MCRKGNGNAVRQNNAENCRWEQGSRIPEAIKEKLNQITIKMPEDKIIRHSSSPWNSPIILVKKKKTLPGDQSGGL
jgi:hypothetical protein